MRSGRSGPRNPRWGGRPSRWERANPPPDRWTYESTRFFTLPTTVKSWYDDFLRKPGQPLVLGSLSILFGFYLAGALSTIFGAAGIWEPTVALGPTLVCEAVTRGYYSRAHEDRSQTLKLLQACKCGFLFGIVVDALKLAG